MQGKKWICILSCCCDSIEIYLQNELKDIKKWKFELFLQYRLIKWINYFHPGLILYRIYKLFMII